MKKIVLFFAITIAQLYSFAQVVTISQPTPGCCWYSGVDALAGQSFTITQAGVITEIRFNTQGIEGMTTVELREGQNVSGPLLYSTVVNITGPGWVIVPIPNVPVCEGVYCYTQSGWQWGDQNVSDPYPGGVAYYSGFWSGTIDQVFEIVQIINNEPTSPTAFTNYTVCTGSVVPLTNYTITDESPATVIASATSSNVAVIPNGNIILGGGGAARTISFSAPPTTPGTTTITLTLSDGNCSNIYTFNVTVNPSPNMTSATSQTICSGGTANIPLTADVASTFSWIATSNPNVTGESVGGQFTSLINDNLTNISTVPQVVTYTVTPSAIVGSCAGTAQTVNITVNPTPNVTPPANQSVCAGDFTTAITFSGTVGGTTYNWTNSNPAIGLAATGVGNISAFTAINASNSPVSATVSVTPTAFGCSGITQNFTFTVFPTPTVTTTGNQTLCNGSLTSPAIFTGLVGGTTFNWTNSQPSIGLAATGVGTIPAFTATNASSTPIVATITVTPFANGCAGTPQNLTITVNPTPNVVGPPNVLLCENALYPGNIFTGAVVGTNYNWTNSNTSIGLSAGGTGNISTFTGLNGGGSTITGNITVTPTANGCVGTSQAFTISVAPLPVATFSVIPDICENGGTYTLVEGSPAGGIYSGPSVVGGVFDPLAALAGTYSLTYIYTDGNLCDDTVVQTITVLPIPTVTASADIVICEGTSANINVTGTASNYNWDNGLGAGFSHLVSPINTTLYTVVGTALNGCSETDDVLVIVNPLPIVSQTAFSDICVNSAAFLLTGGSPVGGVYSGTGVVGGNFDPTTAGVGTHPITYTYTDGGTTCSNFIIQNILVYSAPTVVANATSNSICDGETVTLSGTGANTYLWDNGVTDGIAFTPAVGTITYTVTGSDLNGCQNTATINVTVHALPAVDAGLDLTICEGATITLNGLGATTYSWNNGVTNAIAFSPPIGTTTYIVIGTDANNCEDIDDVVVTVNPQPVLTLSPDQTFCLGDTLTLSAGGASAFDWNSGAGSGTTFSISPTATTSVQVAGTSNGCTTIDDIVLTLDPNLVDAGNDVIICLGFTTYLVATGGDSYTWNGSGVNNETAATVGFQVDTSSYYYLTAVTANGCTYVDSVFVAASTDASCTILPLTTFSPNGDAINESWKIQGINAFPNNHVTILNRWGDVVFEEDNYDNETIMWAGTQPNGAEAPEGTYFFIIEITDGPSSTGWIQLLK